MINRAVFLTTANILDSSGNGGVKASLEHLQLLQNCLGYENVSVCIYIKKSEQQDGNKDYHIFTREENKLKLLFAAVFGCKIYMPWNEKQIVGYLEKYNPDLLFMDFSLLGRLIRLPHKYKTVVFFHNIEADYAYNKVKNEGLFYLPSYWASKRNDIWASRADKVICLNERDSRRLYERYGRKADALIPITFNDRFNISKTITNYKREILFLGSLFPPNQNSIEWFIQKVMPLLDNVKLNIVGKGFETKKEEYEHNRNVHVIGSVDDIDTYYYSHCAVVLPILYGAGMKVKTAEAMMFGRRIFASNEALEGYEVEEIQGITRCNTEIQFATAINHYFQKGIFHAYQTDVRNLFMNKYETNKVKSTFIKTINDI